MVVGQASAEGGQVTPEAHKSNNGGEAHTLPLPSAFGGHTHTVSFGQQRLKDYNGAIPKLSAIAAKSFSTSSCTGIPCSMRSAAMILSGSPGINT